MPSTSAKQARLMRAVAHGWKKPGGGGPSQSVAKEFASADKKRGKFGTGGASNKAKVNNPNPRHGKLDLPVSPVGRFMKMKGRKKYAEGGWSTSVSYDEADAKRRAEEYAASRPKKEAKKPAPKKVEVKATTSKTASAKDDYGSGMKEFKAGFRESLKDKPRAAGPKPGSEAYVDRQVAESREAAARRNRPSPYDAQMMDQDTVDKFRKTAVYELPLAIATLPLGGALGGAARAASAARSANRAAGFIGKAGKEALTGLKKRGQMLRNAQKAREYAKAQKGEWTESYGLGLKHGGSVKKYARGGGVEIRGKTRGRMI